MDNPPRSDNVILLDEMRKGREAPKAFEPALELSEIEPAIDVRAEESVGVTIGLMSAVDPKKDSLGIVMYRIVEGTLDTLGALWLTRQQWEELKKVTERSLKSAAKSRAKQAKKTPSRP